MGGMYKEMKDTMKQLVETKYASAGSNQGDLLTEDERNLLSVAYKNVVGQRRTSWRIVCGLEAKTDDEWKQNICRELKEQVEKELLELCNEIIHLLETYLLPPEGVVPTDDAQQETAVFFLQNERRLFKVRSGNFLRRDQK